MAASSLVTLNVYVFELDASGAVVVLDTPAEVSDLAGFERYRELVWGSDAVRQLGARFFPQLNGGNLYVFPEELADFRRECALLRANLDVIAPPDDEGRSRRDTVAERLANIEAAADRARDLGGGVLIW